MVVGSRLRFLVLALGGLLAACGSETRAGGALIAVDDAGDTVRLAAPASRVVSLIPATTELLFALGAGGQVVGRTAWCDYPAAATAVPNMGDGLRPNLEAVLAQRPDLVILYRSPQNSDAALRLRALGIAEVQLSVDRLTDVDRLGRLLGRLTGHDSAADSLSAAFDSALTALSAPSASSASPKVLILVWDQPPMTIGAGSFLSDLVTRAGGTNLFADITGTSAPVSVEAIVARDPDLILTTVEGTPAFATRPEWQTVRAVRERRFLRVSSSAFSRPSPRAPEAIAELAQRLKEIR